MSETPEPVTLHPETLQAFQDYVLKAEAEMDHTLQGGDFLWSDRVPKRAQQIRKGKILAEFWSGEGPVRLPAALIHDWIAGAFAPGATMEGTLSRIQDYDNHENFYKPEVIESKLISRQENEFKIFLRVLKKKVISVVLDTDHDVFYVQLDGDRWHCRSYTTRVSEVEDAGKPSEKILLPDSGYGFLWRLNSYWRFQKREGGVFMECRAISLTRNIPAGLGWIIEPIVRGLPRESLIATLENTRRAVTA
ncbi:MAG: hypothetical protein U0Q18_05780 [Bryobacteraceae bacterium]